MFRITEDPSSHSLIQYLTKITIVVLSCRLSPFLYSELHTRTTGPPLFYLITTEYAAITPTTSMSTDMIEPLL